MNLRLPAVLVALAMSSCAGSPSAPATDSQARVAALREQVARDDQSFAHVQSLVDEAPHRFAGSENDPRAVAWALARMKALGFANVHAEPVTVPHWVRGPLELNLAGAHPAPLAAVALGGSVATPAGGVEAPVVMVDSLEQLEWLPDAKVRGRIVFFDGRMRRAADGGGYGEAVPQRTEGPARAARKGAVAVVIRSIGTDAESVAHTGRTIYEDGAPKIPAAALVPADADRLEKAVAAGPARLHFELASEDREPVQSANVIGEVPGRSNEIVLLGAHLDSWDITPGANDDGAGVAIVLEAARQILQSGRKPSRTIRVVLYANEEFGLAGAKAYAAAHEAELARHVLAMEADFGSGPVMRLDADVPPAAWPRVEALARAAGIPAGKNGESGGADVGMLRARGVPVLEPLQDGLQYFDVHHTVRDTLEQINRAGLAQNASVYASLAWMASEQADGFGRLDSLQRGGRMLAWSELAQRPLPPRATRLKYGGAASQFGELRVPAGHGPFPVAVIVHGGCWLRDFDVEYMTRLSAALTASGIATWTLEYRRVGEAGGGFPGTFLDVGRGTDELARLARKYPLDLQRVIAIGHSAGGQLALWLAARSSAPAGGELYFKNPLRLTGVLALAPITDLAAFSSVPGCGEAVSPLMGGPPEQQAARYAQVSPMLLPAPGMPVRILHGAYDGIVPLQQSQAYAARPGADATLVVLDDLGHFELVTPASGAWPKVVATARELLDLR